MARKDWPTDPAEIQRSIEAAIQDYALPGSFAPHEDVTVSSFAAGQV
jgi:hypothetical protein